jgi:PAS domain S-box-containing protein
MEKAEENAANIGQVGDAPEKTPVWKIFAVFAALVLFVAAGVFIRPLPEWAVVHLFSGLVPVALAGIWLGMRTILVAAAAAAALMLYKLFGVEPAVGIWADRFAIIFYFAAALAVGMLSERLRFEARFTKKTVEDLKSILEKSIDGVFVFKGLDITFMNARLVEMLGFPREELHGKRLLDLFHEEDAGILRAPARHDPAQTGTVLDVECRMRKSGGGYLRVRIRMIRSPLMGRGAMFVFVHDLENLPETGK